MTFKFIHLTDPHVMPPGQTLCALDPAERLEQALDEIARLHPDAHCLVLTGDLSYHGQEPAYRLLRDLIERFALPCHLLIGNHDDREAFKRIFPETPTDPNGFVQYAVDTPAGRFVMLDTVVHEKEHGELCEARLAWLETTLARDPSRPVFVFMHHPPFDIGIRSIDASKVREQGARDLARILRHAGNMRHLFYGHVHRAIAGSWHGIPTTTLPGTNHQVGLYLGEEPTMVGSHERPAYGVCLVDEATVAVHHKDFTDRSARFVLTDPRSKQAASPGDLVALPHSMRSLV